MADTPAALQIAATVGLNLGLSIAIGALALAPVARADQRIRLTLGAAMLSTLLCHAALLWLEAAAMGDLPLADAAPAVMKVLTATHHGHAWAAGGTALLFALAAFVAARRSVVTLALIAFAASRAAMGHAILDGWLSWAVVVDALHLVAISVWVGNVVIAAWLWRPPVRDHAVLQRFVERLSASATAALAVIVLTGVFNTWRHLGSLAQLSGNDYGNALVVKLLFVGVAVALGGYNRWVVMPVLLEPPAQRSTAFIADPQGLFVRVLRLESLLLLAALGAAAVLSGTAPPGA